MAAADADESNIKVYAELKCNYYDFVVLFSPRREDFFNTLLTGFDDA